MAEYSHISSIAYLCRRSVTPRAIIFQESLVSDRERDIRDIEIGIHELNEVFHDLNKIIGEQGEMIGKDANEHSKF